MVGIGSDDHGYLGIKRCNMSGDMVKSLPALAFEDHNREVLLAVLGCGAITHQPVSGIDQFGQLQLSRGSGGSDWRLQGRGYPCENGGINPIGLGPRTGCLSKAAFVNR